MRPFLPILVALAASLPVSGRVVSGYRSTPTGALAVSVDSIDFRNDLTRLYGKLKGRPHTSHRIDGAALDSRPATDIDGVDFRRYFQWEDDGVIAVEIDFPPTKAAATMTLTLSTVRGPAKTEIRKK